MSGLRDLIIEHRVHSPYHISLNLSVMCKHLVHAVGTFCTNSDVVKLPIKSLGIGKSHPP